MRIIYKYILLLFIPYFLIGNDWNNVKNGINEVIAMSCPDSNNCFCFIQNKNDDSYGPGLYKSTDNGSTWYLIYQSYYEGYPNIYLLNAQVATAPDSEHCFIAWFDVPAISRSNDGGYSFTKIILDSTELYSRNLWEFDMYDSNYGIVRADGGIYFTKDGWKTSKKISSNFPKKPYAPLFLDTNILVNLMYFDNPGNRGYRFMKYHINKNELDTMFNFGYEPVTGHFIDIVKLYFLNDTVGYACGYASTGIGETRNGLLFRTKDGGNNWSIVLKDSTIPNFGFNDISFYDGERGVLIGYYGKIFFTSDGGDTWVRSYLPEGSKDEMVQYNQIAWAGQYPVLGTYAMGIYRYEGDFFDFPPDTTDVKEILKSTDINIRQTPEKLLISIEDENFRKYKLQISDIMGNVVLDQELSSGIGSLFMQVDITSLTNGAYLYMISTGGIIVKTGKIIFIQ